MNLFSCKTAIPEVTEEELELPCNNLEELDFFFSRGWYFGLTAKPDSLKIIKITSENLFEEDSISLLVDQDLNYELYIYSKAVNIVDSTRQLSFSETGILEITEENLREDNGNFMVRDLTSKFIADDGSESVATTIVLPCPWINVTYVKKVGLQDSISMYFR